MNNVEKIEMDGNILAIIIRAHTITNSLQFFTPDEFPLQVGAHTRQANTRIKAHKHIPFTDIKSIPAQEFFYMKRGKVEVGLYHNDQPHSKIILNAGDMVVLNAGHDVTFLEDSEMIEIKQGPYRGRDVEKEEL
jgi:hypothetical protein